MIDISAVRASFPELENLRLMGVPRSGQKEVLRGTGAVGELALKLIKPSVQDNDRTLREIEAVSRLNSPYVPRVIDHGTRDIGGAVRIFIVEEFIEGGTYRERLNGQPRQDVAKVLELGDALLRACVDFEKAMVVHRDIKPENIMIGSDGKVWVIDFGLARILDLESLTASDRHFGPCTPGYGAPEQIRNLKREVDVRADLFSVGVVLYESLNGFNPYLQGKRDALEVIRAMEANDLPALGDHVDAELSAFISVLTGRYPSRRPQTAGEATEWFQPIRDRLSAKGDA